MAVKTLLIQPPCVFEDLENKLALLTRANEVVQ
jgi:hypothetical protein